MHDFLINNLANGHKCLKMSKANEIIQSLWKGHIWRETWMQWWSKPWGWLREKRSAKSNLAGAGEQEESVREVSGGTRVRGGERETNEQLGLITNGLVSHGGHCASTQCEVRSCWRIWWQFPLQCPGGGGNKLLDLKVEQLKLLMDYIWMWQKQRLAPSFFFLNGRVVMPFIEDYKIHRFWGKIKFSLRLV